MYDLARRRKCEGVRGEKLSAMSAIPTRRRGLFDRIPIEAVSDDAQHQGLKRALGPVHLLLLGIGCILGAGIYVLPGTAAAEFAGPAVMLSFVISGAACALTALCFAELAAIMPVSGASYTYCYASMGEVFAWALGWLLMLEYGLAGSLLGVGFSGYLVSLLHDFGIAVPAALSSSLIQATGPGFAAVGAVNLVAVAAILAVGVVLTIGVTESARVNAVLVTIKILVLAGFIAAGVGSIHPSNWVPFVPPNEGGFQYGWPGVFRAASILFFAYLGFNTVSTAASEARDPQKDVPFGIVGSLLVCAVLYIIVAAVMTGVVPFRRLGVPDPIAVAMDAVGHPRVAVLVKLGALTGLSSVLLVNAFGQSRITFAMARDGLLPPLFADIHPRLRTPWLGIAVLSLISALLAAIFPLVLLADLISLGTGAAFIITAISLIWLRNTRPDLERPFRVPLGGVEIGGMWIGYVPAAAILMCVLMIAPVVLDIVRHVRLGQPTAAIFLGVYFAVGALIYALYGRRKSRVYAVDPAQTSANMLDAGGPP
jgi:basic amino acid/polyamine antiporter, APA family